MWVHCNKIHHKLTTQSAPHQNHHHPKHKDEGQKYLIHNVNHRLSITIPRNFQYQSYRWLLLRATKFEPAFAPGSKLKTVFPSHPKMEEKNTTFSA